MLKTDLDMDFREALHVQPGWYVRTLLDEHTQMIKRQNDG